jgi:prolipoprotein diacylglyceryltransferase
MSVTPDKRQKSKDGEEPIPAPLLHGAAALGTGKPIVEEKLVPWQRLNAYCDRFSSLEVRLGGRRYAAFRFWLAAGLLTAFLLSLVLAKQRGLPVALMAATIGVGLLSAYATAWTIKILAGEENFTFYQSLIAASLSTSALMWRLGQPILPYLDIMVVSVGATAIPGRLGCLMVGCCHGRPCRFGIRYGAEHAAAGFEPQLVGLRLFPIQLVEGLAALVIVGVSCFTISKGNAPGTATAWFLISYCATRFCLEFARWPPGYQFRLGMSLYQWISVALVVFTTGLELAGALPFRRWHMGIAVVLMLATAAVVLERRLRSFDQALKHPEHIREMITAIDSAAWQAEGSRIAQNSYALVPVATTSLGLRVSASRTSSGAGDVYHYALSARSGRLTEETVSSLAKLFARSKSPAGRTEILKGRGGVFHLVVHPRNA